jgi:hypothetical protein
MLTLAHFKVVVAYVHRLKQKQRKGKLILSLWVFRRLNLLLAGLLDTGACLYELRECDNLSFQDLCNYLEFSLH